MSSSAAAAGLPASSRASSSLPAPSLPGFVLARRRDRRRLARHDDRRARAQLARILHAVQPPQLAHGDAARPRHVVQRLAEPQHHRVDLVRLVGRARLVDVRGVDGGGPERHAHARRPALGRRAAAQQVRVQRLDHLGLRARGARDRRQRRARGHLDLVVGERRIGRDVREPERRLVAADDRGREDLRHVDARLPGQAGLVLDQLPVVVGVVVGDRAQHGAVAGVVGREHEVPGSEPDVEVLEVARRRVGRPLGIAASVDPVADLQAVGARRAGHELPDAARADARARRALEAALDHRQVEEIARQAVARQHLVEHVAVASRAPQPVRHHRASLGIVLEVVEVAQHLRVPAHREIGQLQRAQPVGVGRAASRRCRAVARASAARAARRRCRPSFRAATASAAPRRAAGGVGAPVSRKRLLLEAPQLAQLGRLGRPRRRRRERRARRAARSDSPRRARDRPPAAAAVRLARRRGGARGGPLVPTAEAVASTTSRRHARISLSRSTIIV